MKKNILPADSYVLEVHDDKIVIGFGFRHFNKKSVEFVVYEGERYERGLLGIIPMDCADKFCSVREYEKVIQVNQDLEPVITINPKCTHEDGHALGLVGAEVMFEADMPLDKGHSLYTKFKYCPECGQELMKSYWNEG